MPEARGFCRVSQVLDLRPTTVHLVAVVPYHVKPGGSARHRALACALQVKEHVEEVMAIVELDKIRGALVGIPGSSGLSVEARKRLSIGVEMVANPSVIFMDEPTSGAWDVG